MRALLQAALLAASVLLAGCLGPVDVPPDAPAPAATPAAETAAPPLLAQTGCVTAFAYFPLPDGEYVRERVPEGFTARSLLVKAWTCASGDLDGAAIDAPAHALLYVFGTPPEDLRVDGVDSYFTIISWAARDPTEAGLLAGWNLDAEAVPVTFEVLRGEVGGRVRVAATTSSLGLELDGLVGGIPSEGAAYRARYFGAVDGTIVSAVDIPVAASRSFSLGSLALRFTGTDAPSDRPIVGTGSLQFWGEDERSYEWRYVADPRAG